MRLYAAQWCGTLWLTNRYKRSAWVGPYHNVVDAAVGTACVGVWLTQPAWFD